MNDLSPVLIGICGFSTVCLGVILIAGFMFLRTAGMGILPGLMEVLSGGRDVDGEEDDRPRRRSAPSAADLRSRARDMDLDFDAAVARYRRNDDPGNVDPNTTPDTPTPSADVDTFNKSFYGVRDADGSPGRILRDRRFRRNRANVSTDSEEDFLGGLGAMDAMDDDGMDDGR